VTARGRAVLDEAVFRELVAGRVVKLELNTGGHVELILRDIGWARMLQAIEDAKEEGDRL
jgi:hypothetical protein